MDRHRSRLFASMADPDHRRQGDWVEALFVARAIARGLNVAKPWSGASRYDFLVEINGRTSRVQVKSCSYRRSPRGYYQCVYRSANRPRYTEGQFDYVAIYVVPEDTWYIIPFAALSATSMITLWPHKPDSKYHRFEEAWHLLHDCNEPATTAASA